MVEMTETANILHNATQNSLVLMDEIGRGTSTYDGLSLAWACAQELALKVKALTLFATHYFELTSLAEDLNGCNNVHLDAVEHNDTLAFLHKVMPGTVNRSYGIQVATLAGIPRNVIEQAKKKLSELEVHGHKPVVNQSPETEKTELEALISRLQPDNVSPKEALEILYQLKKLL
jgi:DNA mismatch repair protein MutS